MTIELDRILCPEGSRPTARMPFLLGSVLSRLQTNWRQGTVSVITPDGRTVRIGSQGAEPSAQVRLHSLRPLWRLAWRGDVGLAEGYIAGEWDTPDLVALLELAARNLDGVDIWRGHVLARKMMVWQHRRNPNTRSGARRNIFAHYDLGNAFYENWLDPSMTYSAALYDRPALSLADAQQRKYAALAQRISLTPEHRVLEIGCGWGGFAEFAAREVGARVQAITISQAQHAFVAARIQRAGLAERVQVELRDYRDIEGWYDRVVSIEMLEAVGERYWPAYFTKLAEVLAPGGLAGLQTITIDRSAFEAYRRTPDFIQTYVFPGGMLPTEDRLGAETARAGLAWRSLLRFGADYAHTLAEWSSSFLDAWPAISALGFDARFRRLWSYYLAYCQAGFRTGRIDVVQMALQKI